LHGGKFFLFSKKAAIMVIKSKRFFYPMARFGIYRLSWRPNMSGRISDRILDRNGWAGPAFSLVELLMVTAIIAVLLSILLPAVNQARAMDRDVRCSHNLMEIGKGFELYINDWSGALPQITLSFLDEAGTCWPTRIDPYLTKGATWYDGIWQCPNDPPRSASSVSVGYGMVEEKFDTSGAKWVRRDQIPSPDFSILLGEGRPFWDIRCYRLYPKTLVGYRHQDRANLLFVDAHVKSHNAEQTNSIAKESLPWDVDLNGN
jgi:prepilin-type processing-associated H-X9-DG protein